MKNGSKSMASALDLPHILQLILHGIAVTTDASITPGHNTSITKNSSNSIVRVLDLLHMLKLILHSTAATASITPGHNRSITKSGSKGPTVGTDLDVPDLIKKGVAIL